MGRPGLPLGVYFRLPLIERGIAWRAADSLALRSFLAIELRQPTPDHTTISRTRRLIEVETHRALFTWMLRVLADAGGECCAAIHRAAGQRPGLDRYSDPGATGKAGPQTPDEGLE